ncbi:TonB-dependent receptor plug domain-containing protein [Bradyrhizobium sp. LMG 9283]|uniref:TonB-dependent receptor plug domain-containing protein n=1 Tax=Bradyrhizobium sp. LMG 9283 TaxID=592064 RepID=UPI00388EE8BD
MQSHSQRSPRANGRVLQPRPAPATDPVAPYKADRLSSSHGETILDTPGQTTVLTRQVLDDKKATSLRDAMRSTAGVTIGR